MTANEAKNTRFFTLIFKPHYLFCLTGRRATRHARRETRRTLPSRPPRAVTACLRDCWCRLPCPFPRLHPFDVRTPLQNYGKFLRNPQTRPADAFVKASAFLFRQAALQNFLPWATCNCIPFIKFFRRTGSRTDNTAEFLVLSSGLQQPELSIQRTRAQFRGGLEIRCGHRSSPRVPSMKPFADSRMRREHASAFMHELRVCFRIDRFLDRTADYENILSMQGMLALAVRGTNTGLPRCVRGAASPALAPAFAESVHAD
jgi:hypothetical protein